MSMKKIYLITFLFLTTISQAQIVNIPDVNFKNALIAEGVDTNNDGEIQVSEAESVSGVGVYNRNISSLEGIQSFTNIEVLYCYSNQLTSLDVTQNPKLVTLFCDTNQLTSLDVSQNPKLETLSAKFNQLTSIDVNQNPNLEWLIFSLNQLTSIDVTQKPNLIGLIGTSNQLTNIDVSQNPNLVWLGVGDNQLKSIDVTQNPNLKRFYCYENQISSVDVSNNSELERLLVNNNQLTVLNTRNNGNIYRMMAHNNPDLNCIQVEDVENAYIRAGFCPGFWSWCKDASAIFSENCSLSTQDFNQISITLYPNPTQDILNIDSQEPVDSVRIYSINGNLVKEASNSFISVSELPSGLYFAQINIGGNSLIKKFIKS